MDLLLVCSSVTPRAIESAVYSVSTPESSLKLDLLFWLFLCAYCTLLGTWVHKQTCACLLVAWASCLCCLRQVVFSEASSVHMSVLACVCTCACVYIYMRVCVCVCAFACVCGGQRTSLVLSNHHLVCVLSSQLPACLCSRRGLFQQRHSPPPSPRTLLAAVRSRHTSSWPLAHLVSCLQCPVLLLLPSVTMPGCSLAISLFSSLSG